MQLQDGKVADDTEETTNSSSNSNHAVNWDTGDDGDDDDDDSNNNGSNERKSKKAENALLNTTQVVSGSSSNAAEGSNPSEGSRSTSSSDPAAKDRTKRAAGPVISSDHPLKKVKLEQLHPERKEAWSLLLAERPETDAEEQMSAWLMKVIAVSDARKPVSELKYE